MRAFVRLGDSRKELTIDEAVERFRTQLLSYAKLAKSGEARRLEIGGVPSEMGTALRFWVGAKA